jgi:fatty acid amide hydrolase
MNLHPATTDVTLETATSIARRIARRELSAREAVQAHIDRIAQVDAKLNAVVVKRFDEALREADAADEKQARGEKLGPLHGVPVTIKEMFDVAGTVTTVGLRGRTGNRARQDAVSVALLRRAGAIVLGKTNVPQLGMMAETDNPVYGRTNNPWNLDRSPGGSSGGEGAIIAAGGSPLGLGSDGGGSIRIPCHACGIHGLKPTSGRLSLKGHFSIPNWPIEWAQAGPMARSVEDLWLAMQVLTPPDSGSGQLDTVPVPLKDPAHVAVGKLRIGMYTEINTIAPSPAIRTAVQEAAKALRAVGAVVEPLDPPDVEEAWRVYVGMFFADGMRHIKRIVRGDTVDWRIRRGLRLTRLPTLARPVLRTTLHWAGQRHLGTYFHHLPKRIFSTTEYFDLVERQQRYRYRFARALDDAGVDAIICPASSTPAALHGEFYINMTLIYTALYNLLGMPAGLVGAKRVAPGEESDRPPSRDGVERALRRIESASSGLPVGVQVVARWWREDIVLAIMRVLEAHFRQRADYPARPPI